MLHLIYIATLFGFGAAAMMIPNRVTHIPYYTPHTHQDSYDTDTPLIPRDGDTTGVHGLVKRDEPSSGLSGGTIGGILAAVFLVFIFFLVIFLKLRRSPSDQSTTGYTPHRQPKSFIPFPSFATPYIPPPPAYNQHVQPNRIYAQGGHPVQMPQTVHLGTRGSYYVPNGQGYQEERGVRFGEVGIRRYG